MKYLEFDTPASKHSGEFASDFKIANHGLTNLDRVFWNLPTPALVEEAVFRGEVHLTLGGPVIVNTGKWTARAANDKFIVSEDNTKDKIKLEIIDREESDDVKYDFYYNKELNIGELSNKSYDEAQKSNTLLHNKILLLGIFLFVKYNN